MAPLTIASRSLARGASRTCCRVSSVSGTRALSTSPQLNDAPTTVHGTYTSPFKGETKGSKIPDFGHYYAKSSSRTNGLFSYFMVGTMGAVTAAGAKSTVQGASSRVSFLSTVANGC
jgi:ubiquinol-cytochrome c reductase iron-sulfur subunit